MANSNNSNKKLVPEAMSALDKFKYEVASEVGVTLKESSELWNANENSYIPFIQNFLSTLYMCYKELDKRFNVVNSKKITKKARIEATVLNNLTPISKAEICNVLPDVSPTTVEKVLGEMVKDGRIQVIGSGKNTKYIRSI